MNRVQNPKSPPMATTDGQKRLMQLGFDPMESLVVIYQQLASNNEDLEFSRVSQLDADKTKPQVGPKYNPYVHNKVLEQQIGIANNLLRFAYKRVSESDGSTEVQDRVFNVHLHKTDEHFKS